MRSLALLSWKTSSAHGSARLAGSFSVQDVAFEISRRSHHHEHRNADVTHSHEQSISDEVAQHEQELREHPHEERLLAVLPQNFVLPSL